jgi:hypothetical protein
MAAIIAAKRPGRPVLCKSSPMARPLLVASDHAGFESKEKKIDEG